LIRSTKNAGNRQQVEQVGSEDHVGQQEIIERGLVELPPGVQNGSQQETWRADGGTRRRDDDQHRAGDRQEDRPQTLGENGVGSNQGHPAA